MRHVHNKLYAAPRGLNMYKTRKAERTGNVVLNYRKRPHSSILSNIIYLGRSRFAHEREWQLPISFPQLKWSLGTTGQQDILKLTFLFVLGRVAWMQEEVFGIKSRYIAWWHLGTIEPERISSLTRFAIFLNCKDAEKHGFLPDNCYSTLNSKL